MALIVRIDVDRPYGRAPLHRHVLSRFSSDFWLPRVPGLGYLNELKHILRLLNEHKAPSYVFFRKCTLPSDEVVTLLDEGAHELGLHLEDSRTFETFLGEKEYLERVTGRSVKSFSKHGSGGAKFGRRHYAPYEPQKYLDWADRSDMSIFLGNLEDPTLRPENYRGVMFHPAAFWLEPPWRNTAYFTIDWLLDHATQSDIVLLIHPENILQSSELTAQFTTLISKLQCRLLQ